MKKISFISLFFIFMFVSVHAQKVGLVLSGGGAKGLAHLGVIQALEDNNIPIDYITGTSIGAVIGSMYAIGYSPKEMLELFKSEDFAYWQSGEVQENYVYSFKRNEPAPDIFNVKFGIKDSLIIETRYFPSSVVDPIQMNLVFFSIFSQATAAAKSNFDSLFVPFRCVASDVYKKESVVFKNGDLGDAVRASMSFPFVFKPIVINNRLLFDGGIYDNFPVVPLQTDFNPDFIIGSNVASNPSKPNDRNMTLQLQNMIIQHTDYSIKSDSSLLINFEIEAIKLLDFYRADELFQIGYDKTIEKIPELKEKIKREIDTLDLQASRERYRDSLPELKFKKIIIKGVNNFQKKYISNAIQENNDFITLEQFKSGYFKLLADKKISEIIPHAVYNEQENCFDLLLDVKLEDEIIFSIGGNISSSVANQAYFGLNYQALSSFGLDFDLSGQFGNAYSSIRFVSQADFTSQKLPFYLNLTGNIHTFNYYQSNRPFYQETQTIFYSQKEDFVKLYAGIPVFKRAKMEMGVGYGLLRDYFYQTPYDFSVDNEDNSRYVLGNIFLRYFINTLNDKQFPNEGMLLRLTGQAVSGTEDFSSVLNIESNESQKYLSWMQVRANFESYYKMNKHFTLGIIADGSYSSRKLSNNYIASVLQAPSFNPTNHSKINFNEAFSANKYLAAGMKPIYNITRQLAFRGEFYVFAPIYSIEKDVNNKAYYGELFSKYNYLGELSLVFRLPFVSISIYGNHYNLPSGNWNVGFNIGYIIFNNKLLD